MELILLTERLRMSPFQESDTDIAIDLFTNPEVLKFAGEVMPVDEIHLEMCNWTRRGAGGRLGIWCVTSRASGEKLGTGALLPMPIEEDDTDWNLLVPDQMPDADIEVGYYLKPSAWGNGYATEICRRLVQFTFEDTEMNQLMATHDPGNRASRNVLLKSGFVDHGTRRSYAEEGPDLRASRKDWLKARAT